MDPKLPPQLPAQPNNGPLLYDYKTDRTSPPRNRIRFRANDPKRPTVTGFSHLQNQVNSARSSKQGSRKSSNHDLSDQEPDFVFKIRTTDAAPKRRPSMANTTVNDRLGQPNVVPAASPSDGLKGPSLQDEDSTDEWNSTDASSSEEEPELPKGWISHMDPASGLPYYIHLPTQKTQWELPTGDPVVKAPSLHAKPRNGVYFGPYLRYTNMDLERGLWLGSVLLATQMPQPPSIHLHQTVDLSPNPRQLRANPIYRHTKFTFYRYDIAIEMQEIPTKWTYAVSSHIDCHRHEFLVAGKYDTNWRFIAHSQNAFAPGVTPAERQSLGEASQMWKDIRHKHHECGGFHAQLGLGGQINADYVWKDVPLLDEWKADRKTPWNAKLEEHVLNAYFYYYATHFDQSQLREAAAQIPSISCLGDADIFDAFGSYPEDMQAAPVFRNVGRIAIDMYLLFQHHTTHEILRNSSSDLDIFTSTGQGWQFIKYLGPAVVVVGPDTRSERTAIRVMAGPTYQGLFPRIAALPPSVQHCIWLVPQPVVFPRLHGAHHLAHTVGAQAAKVADVVTDGFLAVKRAIGKSGLMNDMTSGDVMHELKDMWTDDSKDLERTYVIRTLQSISRNKSLRMTFLSGGVNCAGAGFLHDPSVQNDHKTMYQIIAPSVVNAPSSPSVLRLLDAAPRVPIYVPQNGQKSSQLDGQTDTREDMLELFVADPDRRPREQQRLMGHRGYVVMVAYDPEMVNGHRHRSSGQLCLAAEFLVQAGVDKGRVATVRYGPVVVPSLAYGR